MIKTRAVDRIAAVSSLAMTSKDERRRVDKILLAPRWAQCQTCKESRLEGPWRVNDKPEPDMPFCTSIIVVPPKSADVVNGPNSVMTQPPSIMTLMVQTYT